MELKIDEEGDYVRIGVQDKDKFLGSVSVWIHDRDTHIVNSIKKDLFVSNHYSNTIVRKVKKGE